jgi:predicted O-methyltransferase YrrM
MLKSYFKYRFSRLNAHGLHSPFLFDFYNSVIRKAPKSKHIEIEKLRSKLKKDNTIIQVQDYGAGSRKGNNEKRKIRHIVQNASIPPKYGRLLNQLIVRYELINVLEFGTSLGIGTAYMAQNSGHVTTFEGCPSIGEFAGQNFNALGVSNVTQISGEFNDCMDKISEEALFDLIYIDGNHQYQATLRYFEFALKHSHENSFIIFDDIHWSKDMEAAWSAIKKSKEINVSIDLFRLGIVCKRKGQEKQDFIIKY